MKFLFYTCDASILFSTLKMADNKDEAKDKKKSKRTTKIVYHRWVICGGRKRADDMMTSDGGACKECFDKQLKQPGVFTKAMKKIVRNF